LQGAGDVVAYVLNPLPSLLGKRLGKDFPLVQKTLREGPQADVTRWAKTLLKGENVTLELDSRTFEVTPDEVEVKQKSAEGFAIAEEAGYLAAIDTRLTDDLVMEGLAREVVRRIQTMRRDADFNIDDTIDIRYVATDRLAQAIKQFEAYIRTETLGKSLEAKKPTNGFHSEEFTFDGETLLLGVKRPKA
jgi:isoleucyl-tRNA synthetase